MKLVDQYAILQWLSPQTIGLIDKLEQEVMIDFKFSETYFIFGDYFDERYQNLITNFNPADVWTLFEMILVIALTGPGEFAITSPLFTALIPSLNVICSTLIQFYWNFTINKWWGGGNFFLIAM